MAKDKETIRYVLYMLEEIQKIDPNKVYTIEYIDAPSEQVTPLGRAKDLAETAVDMLGNSEEYGDITTYPTVD